MGNTMTNGLSFLPERLKTDGNATFNTLQQLGGALGTAVMTSVVNAAQAVAPTDLAAGTLAGTQTAFWVLLALSAVALACLVGVFAGKAKGER